MSILFGVRWAGHESVDEGCLARLAQTTGRYAPDGTFVEVKANVGMGFQPYHTHERTKLEVQPLADASGNMLAFDGRLDNHEELHRSLDLPSTVTPDSEIALAAFRRWGVHCFSRFVGDWAIALWSNADRTLHLVRDHAGTRSLYYEVVDGRIVWSTCLDTFLSDQAPRDLDETYIAHYLASQPTHNLTPYKRIHAVPAAHCVQIQGDTIRCTPHWSWMAKDEIRYRTDAQYEEHFL
jgi:asparagine synthase (glutamine-hydrolysing)